MFEANLQVIDEAARMVFAAMPENAPDQPCALRAVAVARLAVEQARALLGTTPVTLRGSLMFGLRQIEFWLGQTEAALVAFPMSCPTADAFQLRSQVCDDLKLLRVGSVEMVERAHGWTTWSED